MKRNCYILFFIVLNLILPGILSFSSNKLAGNTDRDTLRMRQLVQLFDSCLNKDPSICTQYPVELLTLARKTKNQFYEAKALHQSGLIEEFVNYNLSHALRNYRQALAIWVTLNKKVEIANEHNSIGSLLISINKYDSALFHFNICYELYKKLNEYMGLAMVLHNKAYTYSLTSEYNKALDLYYEALKYDSLSNDLNGKAYTFNNIGETYMVMANYAKAVEFYLKALQIFRKLENTRATGVVLNNIGNIYQEEKKYDKALQYYFESLKFKNAPNELINGFLSISGCYFEFNDLKNAELYVNKALNLSVESDYTVGLAKGYLLKGQIIFKYEKYDKSNEYLDSVILYTTVTKDKETAISGYLLKGEIYLIKKNMTEAGRNFNNALKLAEETGSVSMMSRTHEWQYKYFLAENNTKDALKHYIHYSQLKDSVKSLERTKSLDRLMTEYETKLKENEIRILTVQKEKDQTKLRIIVISSVLIIILTGLWLISLFKRNRARKKLNKLLEEKNNEIYSKNICLESQAKQLKEIDEFKSRFFSNISHEFRTPLTLIIGPLKELESETDNGVLKKHYNSMINQANRLLDLVNQLLELSKIEQGIAKISLCEEEPGNFIGRIIDSFQGAAFNKNIKLEYFSSIHKNKYWLDPDKLLKILTNLLSNAIKFTNDNGYVIVMLNNYQNKHDSIEIRVKDNGIGIADNFQPRIFERYFRVYDGLNSKFPGIGIGLAYTYELVKFLKGEIRFTSKEGLGSEFIVVLPCTPSAYNNSEIEIVEIKNSTPVFKGVSEEITDSSPDTLITKSVKPKNKESILIVEDSKEMTEYITGCLSGQYNVLTAANGKEGFEKTLENLPDLIISDIMMPVMDGLVMTRNLKQDERTSHIPVIILTAKATKDDLSEGLETKADVYITKPFTKDELVLYITNLLESRKLLKLKYQKSFSVIPSEVTANSVDELFLQKALKCVEDNIDNPSLDVQLMCRALGMSRSYLHKKLFSLTNYSATGFIRSIRMKRAAQLLKQKAGSVKEIAYKVGFNNLSYFNKCFREEFNTNPSDFK